MNMQKEFDEWFDSVYMTKLFGWDTNLSSAHRDEIKDISKAAFVATCQLIRARLKEYEKEPSGYTEHEYAHSNGKQDMLYDILHEVVGDA